MTIIIGQNGFGTAVKSFVRGLSNFPLYKWAAGEFFKLTQRAQRTRRPQREQEQVFALHSHFSVLFVVSVPCVFDSLRVPATSGAYPQRAKR
jgi:hypothetical protein